MILDMKRSIVSYADTNRLEELKAKMMAAALILPDWLYRERKRLYVDAVAIGIVDGASSTSDHDNGIWRLADIDRLIDVEGAAAAMDAMRHQFGARVQRLLREEARLALDAGPRHHGRSQFRPAHPRGLDDGPSTSMPAAVPSSAVRSIRSRTSLGPTSPRTTRPVEPRTNTPTQADPSASVSSRRRGRTDRDGGPQPTHPSTDPAPQRPWPSTPARQRSLAMRKPTDRSLIIRHSLAEGSQHRLTDAAGAGPDDPAIVVGLAAQYAHLGEVASSLPDPLLQRLRRLANVGDPAARLMLRMLVGRGKAPRSALIPDAKADGDVASPTRVARR